MGDRQPAAAALAVIELPGPVVWHGSLREVTQGPRLLVRFPTVPGVGQRVRYGDLTWVVDEVSYDLRADGRGGLEARPHVRLTPVRGDFPITYQAQRGVLATLLVEEQLGDESYEGEDVHFPALPRAGEFLYECRGETLNVRYEVTRVEHILTPKVHSKPRGEFEAVILVFVAERPGDGSLPFRHPRFSVN